MKLKHVSRQLWLREPPLRFHQPKYDGVNRPVLQAHRMSGVVIAMVEQQLDVMIRGVLRSRRPGSVYCLPEQP